MDGPRHNVRGAARRRVEPRVTARGVRGLAQVSGGSVSAGSWWLPSVGLAVLGVAMLCTPAHWIQSDEVLALESSAIVPEEGHAFLVPLATRGGNDRDGSSALRLFEDGRELGPAHAAHAVIRSTGEGAFSHWGGYLYLSSSDRSDPRSNGRRYEARLPPQASLTTGRVGMVLVLAAAVGALLSAAARTRTRPGALAAPGRAWSVSISAWVVAGALVACAVVVTRAVGSAWLTRARLAELEAALVEGQPATAPPGAPSRAEPQDGTRRTLRLLDAPDALAFRAVGAPPQPRAPVAVAFPGELVLAPGAEVASDTPLDLRVADLAELRLQLRVRQGRSVLVRFTVVELPPSVGEYRMALEIPVEPSEEWQPLAFRDPVVLAGEEAWDGREVRLRGLALGNPALAPGELQAELRDVMLSSAGARFTRATHGSDLVPVGEDTRPAWWQSTAGDTALPLEGAAGRRLRGALALLDPEGTGGQAGYRVEVEDALGARRVLQSGTLGAAQGWLELEADLPRDPAPVRLVIGSDALPPGAALAWSGLRCVDLARPAQRVMLLLLDTLRADATGFSGGPPGATPALDALAVRGASFTRCYSQASWTRPSMPSILTGHYVAATGVQLLGQRLPLRYETLAESFAAAGFHTLAFLTNTNAGPAAGLDQGFDEVVMKLDAANHDTAHILERSVSPRLAARPDDDLFVSVHLMEAHEPFGPADAPADWRAPAGEPVTFDEHLDRPWSGAPTVESRRQLYALDVARMDRALGAFLERWLGPWEAGSAGGVTVAVASDHGEFLGEDGIWGHGWGPMREPVLHVPLLIHAPGRIEPGARCADVVQNVDIGITLLELAGVPDRGSPGRAGRSLLPLLRSGGRDGHASALAALESGTSRLLTVITAGETLVGQDGSMLPAPDEGGFLPRGRAPPLAPADLLLEREPEFLQAWKTYLATQGAWRSLLWEGSASEPRTVDTAELEQLRALGYLGR